jgi:hypothetical protein
MYLAWLGCWSQSERAREFETSLYAITGESDGMDEKEGVRD